MLQLAEVKLWRLELLIQFSMFSARAALAAACLACACLHGVAAAVWGFSDGSLTISAKGAGVGGGQKET